MNTLDQKIALAKKILLETKRRFGNNAAIAWTGGKDSTLILFLVKEIFGEVPWPVFFNDSTMEFEEVNEHINKLTTDWSLNLITQKHLGSDLTEMKNCSDELEKQKISRIAKINALQKALKDHKWKALVTGIRIDEHDSRSDETYFSERENHVRVHPILEFTEEDVWDYIKQNNVPYVKLYDEGYRSLGEKPFTQKSKKGQGERSGREVNKEIHMKQLRSLGYY